MTGGLAKRYARALGRGAPSQRESVRAQVDFLLSCAVGPRQRFRSGIETIRSAFEDKE